VAETIRILLADDHAVLRAGLRALLNDEPDMEVVGEAANGQEAVSQAQTLLPDIIVMDIAMPVMNGLEATAAITALNIGTRVLVLTMHAEEQYLFQVLEAGGSGYVLKQSADSDLMQAIRAVYRGEAFMYPSAVRLLLQAYLKGGKAESAQQTKGRLSEREEQVLALTAEGYSNQEIAGRLYLSSKTVDTYRQRIMEKLDLHHRSELVHYALDRGLLKSRTQPGENSR
jgi:two-component system, NarL family, response regulator NreC